MSSKLLLSRSCTVRCRGGPGKGAGRVVVIAGLNPWSRTSPLARNKFRGQEAGWWWVASEERILTPPTPLPFREAPPTADHVRPLWGIPDGRQEALGHGLM